MDGKKLRIWEAAALAALSITLCLGVWAQARQSEVSSQLVRLHVIAVSDSEQEQALKLRVRDAVLEYLSPVLEGTENASDAQRIIGENLQGIADAAYAAAEGRKVTVTLDRERYPTRVYEAFTLPAGEYESLRVILGEGEGHNWWCVVFPPICLTAAQAEQVRDVLGEEDYALITEEDGYELRFRIVELWGELMDIVSKLR